MTEKSQTEREKDITAQERKSMRELMYNSFFVIPFFILIFCGLLFGGMKILTQEKQTVYDYLENIKIGGLSKRWQSSFELSKILNNPKLVPREEKFFDQMIAAFEDAKHDDKRVRRYLALAMGRTGDSRFLKPLLDGINSEEGENLYTFIYALGMLKNSEAIEPLYSYLEHDSARIRSAAVASLGNIGDARSKEFLKKSLSDPEPNVQWGAAIFLAQMGDSSGKGILAQLLNREYLSSFQEVDPREQKYLILAAIEAASQLNESELYQVIRELSHSDKDMKVRAAAMAAMK